MKLLLRGAARRYGEKAEFRPEILACRFAHPRLRGAEIRFAQVRGKAKRGPESDRCWIAQRLEMCCLWFPRFGFRRSHFAAVMALLVRAWPLPLPRHANAHSSNNRSA